MKRLVLSLLAISPLAFSAPAPFGLELGKNTISQAKEKYHLIDAGTNKYSDGDMYQLDVEELNIDGIESALLIYDKNQILTAVITSFPKEKINDLLPTLKKKYKLIKEKIPFVGNASAKLKDDDCTILLDAPHLGFSMSLSYLKDDFLNVYNKSVVQEADAKKSQQESQL